MRNQSPQVSVVMSVYNAEDYLKEAVESILRQTFRDFEFIIIDDGSVDKSNSILQSFTDPRIWIIANHKNLGLIASLNKGIDAARGQYIARMDADDVSLPQRLHQQVDFLDSHPKVGVVGSWVRSIGAGSDHTLKFPSEPKIIKSWLLFDNTIAHPSVMMRSDLSERYHLRYDEKFKHVEDYELWVRSARIFDIAAIPEVLLLYRQHEKSVSHANKVIQINGANRIRLLQLREMGLNPSSREEVIHNLVSTQDWEAVDKFETLEEIKQWLDKVQNQNKLKKTFDQLALSRVISNFWFLAVSGTTQFGLMAAKEYFDSDLKEGYRPELREMLKFVIKCLLKKRSVPNNNL